QVADDVLGAVHALQEALADRTVHRQRSDTSLSHVEAREMRHLVRRELALETEALAMLEHPVGARLILEPPLPVRAAPLALTIAPVGEVMRSIPHRVVGGSRRRRLLRLARDHRAHRGMLR